MEEKQFDTKSIIGYVLLLGIALWYFYANRPTEEELAAQKEAKAKVEAQQLKENINNELTKVTATIPKSATDSLGKLKAYQELGAFGFSKTLNAANGGETVLENEVLYLKINNQGGYISEARLKKYEAYNGEELHLIKNGANASFGINFNTKDNRSLNTKNLFFDPQLTQVGENKQLSMKLKVSETQFLEYVYVIKPNDYMLDFTIRSQGLENVVDTSKNIDLNWELEALRHAKSNSYENRYTELYFEYENGRDDYIGQGDDTLKLKKFTASLPLVANGGNLNYQMNWYYGPTDYKTLNSYDKNLDEIVSLGWGIFGWINRWLFVPLFGFLSGFLPYGIAIIVMTILVKIGLSPVTYKSYISQARMKVLKPEITEINEKYADNAMKKQQETMKLYGKAGVSPMAGCIPALLQMPILYAMFSFFPSAFVLRQKSFLWADDLSSYDVVANLPFNIPFYGDHISLFPILASIAIFFYMQMTTGQNMPTQSQPGMPNMKFIMYLSPLFMLFFFNNYPSGLSLYYFVSNLITIGIMLVIKNFIIDEDRIHAQIQENKKKPKKQSKFKQRLQEAMEQAEKNKKK